MEEGNYKLSGEIIRGTPGRTYFIEIESENGGLYRSVPEKMPTLQVHDSLYVITSLEEVVGSSGAISNQSVAKVYASSSIPVSDEPIFIKWDLEEVFVIAEASLPLSQFPFWSSKTCFITLYEQPQSLFLYSSAELSQTRIDDQLFLTKVLDVTFYNKHYFNLIQYSITEDAYNYWQRLDQVVNRVGSIFDTPVAKVRGNLYNFNDISEEVLGYFEVAAVDTTRNLLSRANVPFYIPMPCEVPLEIFRVPYNCVPCIDDFDIIDDECLNCLLFPESSVIRPSYF